MKLFKPTQRLLELGLVLQYDSQETAIFNRGGFEREMINQERSQILHGNNDYWQDEELEYKIQKTLLTIFDLKWTPQKPIEYGPKPTEHNGYKTKHSTDGY